MSYKIFERYIRLVDVLGQMFPHVLEGVVYDFKNVDNAIIHIVNGHISGRSQGGPVSEVNLCCLLEEGNFPDQLVNFSSRNSRGQKLKSSSLAIRDDEGKLIGALCLHFDLSYFEQFQKFLGFFSSVNADGFNEKKDFKGSPSKELEIRGEIENWLFKNSLHTAQLTYQNKQAIVDYLYQTGRFEARGAISAVANALQLTRQCIYNYVEIARKKIPLQLDTSQQVF